MGTRCLLQVTETLCVREALKLSLPAAHFLVAPNSRPIVRVAARPFVRPQFIEDVRDPQDARICEPVWWDFFDLLTTLL
ncbi:hypothetical protein ASF75_16905 [Curtobacterium sp. Leaf154]|nr:hypothetical protein ASF75_16905 [Curtobacterium sp. Leaf154]TPG05210.1 hypothetical protein EAH85_14695 [Curtobacterium flaccumfaciens]